MAQQNEAPTPGHGENVLQEKVDEYKKAHPEALPEVDFAFVLKSLDKVNEESPVKVAKNAFDEKREWIPGTSTRNISDVFLSEDHCVTVVVSGSDVEMTVEQFLEKLRPIMKKLPLKTVPVKAKISDTEEVRITDVYAHSLVTKMWAGLPVDFVLCYSK